MENTVNFSSLYRQYLNAPLSSGKRYGIYKRMVKSARSFGDWNIVHQYGDNSYQYLAEQKMKAKVLNGKKSSDVQENILNLFEIVTDENEQNEILRAFLSKYNKKEDFLFVMEVSMSPCMVTEVSDEYNMTIDEIDEVIGKEEKRLQENLSNWRL